MEHDMHVWNPPYEEPIGDSQGGGGHNPANQPDLYQPRGDYQEGGLQSGLEGDVNFRVNLGVDPSLYQHGSGLMETSPLATRDYTVGAGRAAAHTRRARQNEMSAHHLDTMLQSDSPLMRRARMRAAAGAAGRGLMNSSIAQGAAEGAMIDRAQPFALQDAQAHQRAASESLAARNQAELTNAELTTRARLDGARLNAGRDQSLLNADLQGGQDVLRHALGIETREDQQQWQGDENTTQRGWQSDESALDRDWRSAESVAQRDWQTKEREGGQEFQNQQRIFTQIWQSEENKQRAVERWYELNLQRSSNREVALGQTLSQIYNNPNLTAAEQKAAAASAREIMASTYGVGDTFSPPPWMDGAARGQATSAPVNPQTAAYNHATGQVYSSSSNPSASGVTASLPPII